MIFKYKQVEQYNLFDGLKDVNIRLHNIALRLNDVDSTLSRVETYLVSVWVYGDLNNPPRDPTDPPMDNSQEFTVISFDQG